MKQKISFIVKSFIEMTKFLLTKNPGGFFLSERISQDPLENYFGKQRARGGRNDNPTMQQCLHNAAAIRVQKSLATNPIHGNCKRNLVDCEEVVDDTPLPKRKRQKLSKI